jgi:hypothetical protein
LRYCEGEVLSGGAAAWHLHIRDRFDGDIRVPKLRQPASSERHLPALRGGSRRRVRREPRLNGGREARFDQFVDNGVDTRDRLERRR